VQASANGDSTEAARAAEPASDATTITEPVSSHIVEAGTDVRHKPGFSNADDASLSDLARDGMLNDLD
jgi:hypothetical protein